MGLALITVGTIFNGGIEEHPELGYPAIFALLIFIIRFAMSAGPIIWVMLDFPTRVNRFLYNAQFFRRWLKALRARVGLRYETAALE